MGDRTAQGRRGRPPGRLPWKSKLGYGVIGLAVIGNAMVTTWQLFFFTTFAGMNVALAGLIVATGQIVAALVAPAWGYLSDRLYLFRLGRKIGRRRLTLLLAAPGLFIFNVVQFVAGLPVWAYAVANFLYWAFEAGFATVRYILPAEMTDDPAQRAQLVGINQISSAVSSIGVSAVSAALFALWGDRVWTTYLRLDSIYAVAMLILLIAGLPAIPEQPMGEKNDFSRVDAAGEKGRMGPLTRLKLVAWNHLSAFSLKEFRNYLGMYLSQFLFRSVRGATLTYFLVFVLGLRASEVSISQGLSFLVGIGLVAFFMWLNTKIGGTRAYRAAAIEAIAVFAALFVLAKVHGALGHGLTVTAWIALALALNVGVTGVVNSTDLAYSFIPDVDEMLTGKRREGQFASINSTIGNLFNALSSIAITGVLAASGFVEGAVSQPANVVSLIAAVFCLVPIAFCLLGIFFSFRVHLDEGTRARLSAEIARLRAGGSKADATPEARALAEELTGYGYDKCWGDNRVISYNGKRPVTPPR